MRKGVDFRRVLEYGSGCRIQKTRKGARQHGSETSLCRQRAKQERAALRRNASEKGRNHQAGVAGSGACPRGANKTKVNKAFREVVAQYEQEFWEEQERGGRPPADIPVYDYLVSYLKRVEPELQKNTIVSYRSMTNGKIRRYFQRRPQLTVGNLKPQDIQDFYQSLFADGVVANTVIHYHALLRRAFQQAFKEERIDANPFDRVGRPKKNKFHGENYTQEELLTLLHLARGDVIYPAILLAGAMGLRRSEALGVRWSRIDWEKRTVLLDTKIVEYRENGKKKVEPVEEMKNKSSRRTLPLPDPVVEMLQVQKEHREVYRKMFQGSYNAQYLDYVCVNQLGELLRPSYVTDHFRELLEKYGLRAHPLPRPASHFRQPAHQPGRAADQRVQLPGPLGPLHHRQHLRPPGQGQQAGQRRCDFGHSPGGEPARPAEGRTRNQYRQTNVKGAPLWDALIL